MRPVNSVSDSKCQATGRDMAERLGLGPEIRELKLGPTFTDDRSTAFHTLKYDFKPASIDVSKIARVDAGANNTMTITVPHLDGSGIPYTVFKGSQRPYHKECVLIIDRVTGEITLEKLSANIQVKKTLIESKSQSQSTLGSSLGSSSDRPITPIDAKRSPTHGRANGRTKVTSGKKREPSVQLHPKQLNMHRVSPYHGKCPPVTSNESLSLPAISGQSTAASLPMISSENDDFDLSLPSSMGTTHSSTPSISQELTPVMNSQATAKTTLTSDSDKEALSDSSSSSSSSDSSDSDSETENIPVPMANDHLNGSCSSPALLMPDHLLNDDLQLSESESDSD